MSNELSGMYQRLLNATENVNELEANINALKEDLVKKETVPSEISSLLAENQKLRYRLNIMKRAASEMDSSCDQASDSKAMYGITKVLVDLFGQAIKKAYPEIENAPTLISLATSAAALARKVDYQCNSALPILKELKSRGLKVSPNDVGQKIVSFLPSHAIIGKVEVAPAGFINIALNRDEVERLLHLVLDHGVQPPSFSNKKLRVVVDFSSPNIAKEMHVGHLRSTIIGDSICRFLEFLGHDVLRINHVGDWGTQFGMLIAHLQDEFPNYREVSPPVADLQAFYKQAKQRFDEDEEFKKRAYACVVKLQNFDPDHTKAWNLICDVSRKEFQKVYDRLGIVLTERGESFYQTRMDAVVKELTEKGLLQEDEGRKILWCDEVSVPFTIVKSDGGYTYDTSDMATIKQRLTEEKADWLIYVTDAGQAMHFEILRHSAIKVGYLDPTRVRMDHVAFGVVLGEDGKKFKTRSGDTVRLVSLLDEGLKRAGDQLQGRGRHNVMTAQELEKAQNSVAYGCIKYADLLNNRINAYVFSFDKMLDDKGNTAVYLLYALTRIRAIARLAGVTPAQIAEASKTTRLSLDHEKEYKLGKVLARYADVFEVVYSTLCLHHICDFLYEIACTFSEFYDSCYCVEKNASGEIVKVNMDRILLCEITARMMEKCFFILGLETVDKIRSCEQRPPVRCALHK